jgi:hypothetical protein
MPLSTEVEHLGVLLYVASSAASENIVHAHTVWGVEGNVGELIDVVVTLQYSRVLRPQ